MSPLLVLGELMVDVVAHVSGPLARGSDTAARISTAGGGSGANVAAWAAWLGERVALVCRIGDDERGRFAVDQLHVAGVEVHAEVDEERATGTCVVIVEPGGERTMLPDPGANDAPSQLPEPLLAPGAHLHVSGYSLVRAGARPGALAAIERARAAGMTISIDPSSWALLRGASLPPADLLLPNAAEAAVLGGGDDPRALVRGGGEVVVKLGADGALWTDGSEVVRVPAEPVAVVDTTGAGDAFAAGLHCARVRGAAPREALEAGCRTAAEAVGKVGARPN